MSPTFSKSSPSVFSTPLTIAEGLSSKTSHPTLKKIQDIEQKITQLTQEKLKLKSILEQKILYTLHKHNAFDYDFETLLSGIHYVLQTLKSTEDDAKQMCASWKAKGSEIQASIKRKKVA